MQSDSMCFRVQVVVKCMNNQLTQLGELDSIEIVVNVCCNSERSSDFPCN